MPGKLFREVRTRRPKYQQGAFAEVFEILPWKPLHEPPMHLEFQSLMIVELPRTGPHLLPPPTAPPCLGWAVSGVGRPPAMLDENGQTGIGQLQAEQEIELVEEIVTDEETATAETAMQIGTLTTAAASEKFIWGVIGEEVSGLERPQGATAWATCTPCASERGPRVEVAAGEVGAGGGPAEATGRGGAVLLPGVVLGRRVGAGRRVFAEPPMWRWTEVGRNAVQQAALDSRSRRAWQGWRSTCLGALGAKNLGEWDPRVTQYLTTVCEKSSRDMGVRNRRELRTLAEALDHMLEGNYLQAADMLMARFTSVELASTEQSWAVSQHLELIPSSSSGAANETAKRAAAKEELTQAKLRKTLSGSSSNRDTAGRGRSPQRRVE